MLSFSDLVLHPKTRRAIENFINQSSHALLVEAPHGGGKATLLETVASELGAARPEHRLIIQSEKRAIGLDEVKSIHERLKLKSYNNQVLAVLIHNAEKLSPEAQNSLLKLLEEPPYNVVFLISTADKSKLLPTVRSRTTLVTIMKPGQDEMRDYLKNLSDRNNEIDSALAISNGWIGLASTLLREDENIVASAIKDGKEILSLSMAEKLRRVEKLTKQKDTLDTLFYGIERILHSGLHNARKNARDMTTWQAKLKALTEAQTGLRYNVSTRLVLTRLMLSL